MNGHRLMCVRVTSVQLILMSCMVSLCAHGDGDRINPQALVRQVVENELKAKDTIFWRYLERAEKNGTAQTHEVIQTTQGDLYRVIQIDGHALTPEEIRNENERIGKVRQDHETQLRMAKQSRRDSDQLTKMTAMLPDAFLYQYEGEQDGLIRLAFRPNPDFHPPCREAEVFHAMTGAMFVDGIEKRFAGMSGVIAKEVKFGGGFIGRLNRGGFFAFKRAELAPGAWIITYMSVDVDGKILFLRTLSLHQKDFRSDFSRVGDNLTLAQASAMLLQQPEENPRASARN